MVVRLHPGQASRLSAFLEEQVSKLWLLLLLLLLLLLFPQDKPSSRTWLAELLPDDSQPSILGLEISFSSEPQDIDIRVIPGTEPAIPGE